MISAPAEGKGRDESCGKTPGEDSEGEDGGHEEGVQGPVFSREDPKTPKPLNSDCLMFNLLYKTAPQYVNPSEERTINLRSQHLTSLGGIAALND